MSYSKDLSELMRHTPPTWSPTSYENTTYLKRPRAGSISGRLRSVSDLEELGVITHAQKGNLKNLIISGTSPEVSHALDMFEGGENKQIQELVGRGYLDQQFEIDLLNELDTDFLGVGIDEEDEEEEESRRQNVDTSSASSTSPTIHYHDRSHHPRNHFQTHHHNKKPYISTTSPRLKPKKVSSLGRPPLPIPMPSSPNTSPNNSPTLQPSGSPVLRDPKSSSNIFKVFHVLKWKQLTCLSLSLYFSF